MARRLAIGSRHVPPPPWDMLIPDWDAVHPMPPPTDMAALAYNPLDYRTGPRGRAPSPEARAIVARMAGFGFPVTKIARLTGFRPSTLYRVFREELTTAADLRDLDVIESAYHQAVGGPEKNYRHADASMTRFWLGKRLGWRQPTAYDQARNSVEVDLDRLSDEELHELDRLIGRASDGEEPPAGD